MKNISIYDGNTLPPEIDPGFIDAKAMQKLSYGLFVLTAAQDGRDNGCIINTAAQLTTAPARISICVNKGNLTHDMILATKKFNISVLSEKAGFDIFTRFGFASGRNTDKFDGFKSVARGVNGVLVITAGTNSFISAEVSAAIDCGTHTLFIADVTCSGVLNQDRSATYQYYFDHIKPKPAPAPAEQKKGYVCKICGYVYEGETLPPDFVCPTCKHGAEDFEPRA